MKTIIISCILAIIGFMPLSAEPVNSPAPQYGSSSREESQVNAYYYNYSTKTIESVPLKVNNMIVKAIWDKDFWQTLSVRAERNKTGDLSDDAPEAWKKESKRFRYKVTINKITLYYNLND